MTDRGRGIIGGLAVLALVGVLVVPSSATAAPCDAGARQAFIVGIVYDRQQRSDFIMDVGNFRTFADTIGQRYCVPPANERLMAFDGTFVLDGVAYPRASETAFKQALAATGAAAARAVDPVVFVMLSSHGIAYGPGQGCGVTSVGSRAALDADGAEDGALHDCELGAELAEHFAPGTDMVLLIDCSLCGGFSDSLTAVSGTVPDDEATSPSGVPGPHRIVITGCAVTTECFGDSDTGGGGVLFVHLRSVLERGVAACDGFTSPGFPALHGINTPVRLLDADGACTVSEWFFAAVDSAYRGLDPIDIQEQFRIKYGFDSLSADIRVL